MSVAHSAVESVAVEAACRRAKRGIIFCSSGRGIDTGQYAAEIIRRGDLAQR
jgi:hypothetical protein